jgi:hypothetical protein
MELGSNVMKETQYFVSLLTSVVMRSIMLWLTVTNYIGTTEYLTLEATCGIKRRRYKRVRLYLKFQ